MIVLHRNRVAGPRLPRTEIPMLNENAPRTRRFQHVLLIITLLFQFRPFLVIMTLQLFVDRPMLCGDIDQCHGDHSYTARDTPHRNTSTVTISFLLCSIILKSHPHEVAFSKILWPFRLLMVSVTISTSVSGTKMLHLQKYTCR